ncbi:LOW QUALITY PROTEIN: arylsulfatase B-like [Haliotis rubra]|uniref:LOW QUALITY PROTEIN: arylsulfatase B-like n=1 Tax=Haliotis rubra TaxID=36100 RepID=UPI001EE50A45|nr:LOW QUALITY PROTEIN: arylsulfatase B-like [Haliotis rubra]
MFPGHAGVMVVLMILALFLSLLSLSSAQRPNIVFIVADDLGWNDVGFRNPDMKTPNIDKLATEGIIFENAYVQNLCSPSRTAFMSGMYPFHAGMQHEVLLPRQAVCVPLNYTFLPQELKKLGYATHMIGKWHLGFCKWECTPTYRGFDTYFGYYNAAEDYYNHSTGWEPSLDYHDNLFHARNYSGVYSAFTFAQRAVDIIHQHNASQPLFMYLPYQNVHAPIEVPKMYEDMYPNVVNTGRRIYSGMVSVLDEAVGNVTQALKDRGLFENTLILFTADNGGPLKYANNWPLRGGKHTVWEGGTKGASFMYGAGLQKTKTTYDGMIHAVDWKSTLVSAAGGTPESDIDGMSHWDSIRSGLPSSRTEFIYNIDDFEIPVEGHAGIRVGDYKLILGYPGGPDGWHRPMNRTQDDKYEQTVYTKGDRPIHLFNIREDPTEHNDLAQQMPDMVAKLRARFEDYKKTMVPANFPSDDAAADPRLYGGAWTPGWC